MSPQTWIINGWQDVAPDMNCDWVTRCLLRHKCEWVTRCLPRHESWMSQRMFPQIWIMNGSQDVSPDCCCWPEDLITCYLRLVLLTWRVHKLSVHCAVDYRQVCSTVQRLPAAWLSGTSQLSAGWSPRRSQQVSHMGWIGAGDVIVCLIGFVLGEASQW